MSEPIQQTTNQPRKRLKDLSLEERRLYDREAKQRSRAKDKLEKQKRAIPDAWDYVMPDEQRYKLDRYTQGVAETVAAELGLEELSEPDVYVVNAVASVLFGLENNLGRAVNDPFGFLIGGWFPDAAVSEAIEHVHRFPHILQSTVFSDLYNQFLLAVANWSKKNELYATHEYIQELNQEIAGEYVLKVPETKAEPKPESTPEALPSGAQSL